MRKKSIEFENQSYAQLIKQLKEQFYNCERHKFTKSERETIYNESDKLGNSRKKQLTEIVFHIDHIKPLANGGTNEKDNLQLLCVECHFDKTRNEQENGYLRISDTESSFNNLVYDEFKVV